jgi:hypothetical protein
LLLLVVTGCGGMGAAPAASHKASPSVESSSALAIACRLPIATSDAPVVPMGPIPAGHGGFVSVPSGVFTVDRNSLGAYDTQRSTWLPVTPGGISPDGSSYAWVVDPNTPAGNFPPGTGKIDINNLDGGGYGITTPRHVRMVAWTPSGMYVASAPNPGAPSVGLSLINTGNNVFGHDITSTGSWPIVGYQFAYGAAGNRIESLNLETGLVTPVFTVPGARVFPVGLDYSYNVIVGANTASGYAVTIMPSNQQIFSGPSLDTPSGASDPTSAVADTSGVWLSSAAGDIWHYTPGEHAVKRIGSTGLASAHIAGTCV